MIKKLVLASLAGSVVQFLLGWLIYGVLLAGFMNSQSAHYPGLLKDMNSPDFIILIYLSGLMMSFFIAYVFLHWAKFETYMKGLTGGMFIGFFISLTYDLSTYSMMNLMSGRSMVVDIIIATIVTGIVGGVIAWVLGMKSKTAAASA